MAFQDFNFVFDVSFFAMKNKVEQSFSLWNNFLLCQGHNDSKPCLLLRSSLWRRLGVVQAAAARCLSEAHFSVLGQFVGMYLKYDI